MKNPTDLSIIENCIYYVRGQRIMLDTDLAALYGVATKNLNKAVRRNRIRFPEDFSSQLTEMELANLRFQIGTSRWGGRRYRPFAFTEQGVAMLSSVLKSERAALVNIAIMRTFVKLRHVLAGNKDLAKRVEKLEKKVDLHDTDIRLILQDIRKLLSAPEPDVPAGDTPKIRGFVKD